MFQHSILIMNDYIDLSIFEGQFQILILVMVTNIDLQKNKWSCQKYSNIKLVHIGKWTDNHGRVSSKMIEYVKSISPSNIYYLGFVDKKEGDYAFFGPSVKFTWLCLKT